MLTPPRARIRYVAGTEHRSSHTLSGLKTGPEREASNMGRHDGFEAALGTEFHGWALIDSDQNGLFSILMEELGMGSARAGCDSPVDSAHVVTGCVGSHLIKFHAAPPLTRPPHTREVGERPGVSRDVNKTGYEPGGN